MSRNLGYAQNKEDLWVLNYFRAYKGTLLSIGENDGVTLSNARLLIENGWGAYLVEPGSVYKDLEKLYALHAEVATYNFGIGTKTETVKFYESGAHVKNGSDRGLVSTVDPVETERWRKNGVKFVEKEINLLSFEDFYDKAGWPVFDFISIDAEGFDWLILQQIDLAKVECKVLCIEWNGDYVLYRHYVEYCKKFSMQLRVQNNENLIFVL